MNDILSLFPETYDASRERFRGNLSVIQQYWPAAKLSQHLIAGNEDLTIDWIQSAALETNEKVFIFLNYTNCVWRSSQASLIFPPAAPDGLYSITVFP